MDGIFEIGMFHLKPGVEREQFLAAAAQTTDWMRTRPGYLGRELLEDESGLWIDLLRWASLEEALASGAAFMETEAAAALMNAIDLETIRLMHPRRVAAYD